MAGRKPTVSDQEILQVLRDRPDRVLFTGEVRDEIGLSTNKGTRDRLDDLVERGLVAKKTGPATVWWITDSGREYLQQDPNL